MDVDDDSRWGRDRGLVVLREKEGCVGVGSGMDSRMGTEDGGALEWVGDYCRGRARNENGRALSFDDHISVPRRELQLSTRG